MKIKEGGGMDLQKERESFKAWFKKEYLGIDNLANQGDEGAITRRDYAYVGWQAAKAQAVPEGFVLVPKEPYAYLIKHKLWQKDSDPEIFLAVDFLGDDGIEKDKLTVCMPLYLGDDEAQEPAND
ncbi:hypothetical protein [Acinetobacter schindleri]|uniref:hypothetical protein n=1 Tax=Acinetobacter schindleri TaxID=108981 RepID=UPI003F5535EC